MSFSKKITDLKREVLKESEPLFAHIEDVAEANTLKVLDAMRECRVSDAHFNTTTGYAYDDIGRGKLEELYAKIFGAERALVRTQFVSGTHALATVLFGILRPGDELVSLTGKPYDTMQTVIGYDNPSPGSLKEFGVLYNELPMVAGKVDMAHIKDVITDKTKMVEIQRSRGYSMRSPLSIEDIRAITTEVHRIKPDCICFVDNCYGEFTLSNGDTMKLWKVKDAYADLSALPMKGMAEEFPIEAEAEQIYVADVTSNGETTRQYLRTDKAGRNGTVSVKTFELGDAE